MISLNFSIKNPWATSKFNNLFSYTSQLSDHKFWEVEIYREPYRLIGIDINLQWRGIDHAGPELELSLFTYTLTMKIYDNRHWNSTENKWVDDVDSYNGNPYDYT